MQAVHHKFTPGVGGGGEFRLQMLKQVVRTFSTGPYLLNIS